MPDPTRFSFRGLLDALRRPAEARPGRGGAEDPSQGAGPFRVGTGNELVTPALRRVWTILEGKRGERRFLSRADIDPGDLVFVLPFVALIEVHQPGPRFRHRLVGTGFRNALGFEATGLWVEEWPQASQRGLLMRGYVAPLEARQAVGFRRDLAIGQQVVRYEAMIVPLAESEEAINMLLLAVSQCDEPDEAEA